MTPAFKLESEEYLEGMLQISLKPLLLVLAIVYLVYAASHYFLIDESYKIKMVVIAAMSSFVCLIIYGIIVKKPIPKGKVHLTVGLIAIMVFANCISLLLFSGGIHHSTNLMILIFGISFMIISKKWLIFLYILVYSGWIFFLFKNDIPDLSIHYGFALMMSGALAVLVYIVKVQTFYKLVIMHIEVNHKNEKLESALDKIEALHDLMPICASCKKIRDDGGYWHQVEEYIRDHSYLEFSHGLCPDCALKLYPEYYSDSLDKNGNKE